MNYFLISNELFSDGKNDVMQVWSLLDKIVQQLILQLKKGEDPDGAPLEEINVKQLIRAYVCICTAFTSVIAFN